MQAFREEEYTKNLDFSLWKRLIVLAKPFYRHLIGIMVLMLVSALLDVYLPMMNSYAIDVFIANNTTEGLAGFIVLYVLMVAAQVVTIFWFLTLSGRVETGMTYHIRSLGFHKLQELPFSYYDRMPAGYLMSRMTSDTQRIGETIGWSILDLAYGAVFLVACSVQMLVLNWRLALVVMLNPGIVPQRPKDQQ